MTKRMLIDATHAEETRVVVLDGNRLEDFDVETSTKKQLKGNIYLAKVVRVEPSLQAAFVEYGGGRHGFLAFGEIHPDYYQIPVADRQRLLELQAEEAREEEEAEEAAERARERGGFDPGPPPMGVERFEGMEVPAEPGVTEHLAADGALPEAPGPEAPGTESREAPAHAEAVEPESVAPFPTAESEPPLHALGAAEDPGPTLHGAADGGSVHAAAAAHVPAAHSALLELPAAETEAAPESHPDDQAAEEPHPHRPAQAAAMVQDVLFGEIEGGGHSGMHIPGAASAEGTMSEPAFASDAPADSSHEASGEAPSEFDVEPDPSDTPSELPPPETIGGETDTYDGAAEARARRASRLLRNYRIQEVIHRRQIMLIQVVKEERGTKGAALTTYISLAGRYCVLMPNSPRGGGISRKITSAADRRRLKEITTELEIPRGMGLIVRTAGANRPKPEIRRDCEYLMRLWDDIREHTLNSVAPALIYEEASLIKRAIRDVYSRDVEDVLVDGEQGWKAAHDFMRMLMPSHARKVQLWRPDANGGGGQPLFSKHGVEAQLDGMLSPTVQLRSGGYLVIAQTEALVSIDVNSGRSTRERGIEETALKTNLEAADEVARQLRLRDLAGLIVIDFIDMEAKKHNAMVERRMKEALKNDRARIQLGHISHFGLMEMSRQRLRPSLAETSFVMCAHCGGAGHVRSVESSAIHVLREIEDEGAKRRASLIMVYCGSAISMYLLNNKRDRLGEIEQRYAMRVHFTPDDTLIAPNIRIDRLRPQVPESERPMIGAPVAGGPVIPLAPAMHGSDVEEDDVEDEEDAVEETEASAATVSAETPALTAEEGERRRRRRRRRGGRRDPALPEGGTEGGIAVSASAPDIISPEEDAEFGAVDPAMAVSDPAPAAVVPAGDQPVVDPLDFDENGLPRSRGPRRSRRGGRRRRRDDTFGGDVLLPMGEGDTPEPVFVEPAYNGPTPADPFARPVFDIFDLMDRAEEARAAAPPPAPSALDIPPVPPHATAPAEVVPHVEPPVADAPVGAIDVPEPEPHAAPRAEPAAVALAPPHEPATEPHPVPHIEPAHDPVAAAPAPEPEPGTPEAAPPEPLIKPIVIGADPVPGERKRGWWRN